MPSVYGDTYGEVYGDVYGSLSVSPIIHFPLNDNLPTTAVDALVGLDGTLVGGNNTEDLYVGEGNGPGGQLADYGLNLDGTNDHISCTSSQGHFDWTTPFSVAGWFYHDTSPGAFKFLVGRQSTSGNFEGWTLNDYPSDPLKLRWTFIRALASRTDIITTNQVVEVGEWQHFAAVWHGTTGIGGVDIYVNGVAQAKTLINNTLSGTVAEPSQPMTIGGQGAGNRLDGSVADIRVYNQELSSSDITTLYNMRLSGIPRPFRSPFQSLFRSPFTTVFEG